ncbi:TIGR04104 family putative zinc finger protein [Alkalibaculum sporogenes]|uniref:TIGR04104 family putative zinc finger protein n=1 Tax=Alkalibaculum sporogenes TaxID=2655001 RepID=UPI00128B68C9
MSNWKCIKCSSDIKYGAILKSYIFTNTKPIKCNECKSLLYANKGSRLWLILAIALPMGFLDFLNSFPLIQRLSIWIIWLALVVLTYPLVVKFRIDKEL